jgi:superfamily II DNA/RNA helicase
MLLKLFQSSSDEKPKKVLIFCEPHRPMHEMAQVIENDLNVSTESSGATDKQSFQASVSVLLFEDGLTERAAAMESFRGEAVSTTMFNNQDHTTMRILLSTDLAARGLDIVDITHVIHFDLPPDADTYTHRAGRAGRFGRSGQVISIIPAQQDFVLQRLANRLNLNLRCMGKQKTSVD